MITTQLGLSYDAQVKDFSVGLRCNAQLFIQYSMCVYKVSLSFHSILNVCVQNERCGYKSRTSL